MRSKSFILVVLSLTYVLFAVTVSAGNPQYLGCFEDSTRNRALAYGNLIDTENMSMQICRDFCNTHGYPYFGVQYASECYCGKDAPKSAKLTEDQCSMTCAGNTGVCGGTNAMSTYFDPSITPRKHSSKTNSRPLISLVMILKDEAHTIMDTLTTVHDYIDSWIILDTGSTDGTQQIILDYMKDIPGQLYEEPFIDYGASRNRVLELAQEQPEPAVYTLMLSADERVMNPGYMRDYLDDFRNAVGNSHGAYIVQMDSGVKFDSLRIARVDSDWRYKDRVHEYLAPPAGKPAYSTRPPTPIIVKFKATDPKRRMQSQYYIRDILKEDIEIDPNNTRSMIYLARTNSILGNHTEAEKYYLQLSRTSTWDEEQYHALVMAAEESKQNGKDWKHRAGILLEAFEFLPTNRDALHALAQECFNNKLFDMAFMFTTRMTQIKRPKNIKTVQSVMLRDMNPLYDFEGMRLHGFAASEVTEYLICATSLMEVMITKPEDKIAENRMNHCVSKLNKADSITWDALVDNTLEKMDIDQAKKEPGTAAAPPQFVPTHSGANDYTWVYILVGLCVPLTCGYALRHRVYTLIRKLNKESKHKHLSV